MKNSNSGTNSWRFFRAGGFDQVKLERGADFQALGQLDLKLWVALACPISGLEFDKTTLTLIDTDNDGRIRAPELIEAVKWTVALLKNPDDLLLSAPTIRVDAINQSTPEGQRIARFVKTVLGKGEADPITIEETSVAEKTFAGKAFNGDGIVGVDAVTDPAAQGLVQDIIACLGADTDVSGKPGISQAKLDQFFAEAKAYSDWWNKSQGNGEILPLGVGTPAAAAAVRQVRAKVDDFFARCRCVAFDHRAANGLNREEKEFLVLGTKELTATSPEIAAFPLARVEAGADLPLSQGVNPAWAAGLALLQSDAVKPLLGERAKLSEADWTRLVNRLAPYEAWSASKAGAAVEKLGLPRLNELLEGKAKAALAELIAKDKAEEANAQAIGSLNRLVRYHRDLNRLCHNFVSFQDFYSRERKAIFQAGTLFLDQRSCDLCVSVEDAGKHAAMAGLAGTYLAYCDCFRKGTGEKRQIVAAFTNGDSDNLMAGRNGVFFDRQGRDWDATITKIIDNPISIRQAFFSPYKKLVRMIEEQVAKRAAAADAAADAKLAATAKTVANADAVKPGEPAKPKVDTGTLAAIGLVLTTLLGALSALFGYIFGLPWWQIPLAVLAIIVAVSAPSMLIAYLKLRRRNLGPILDANGWAVNAKARLNVPFGAALTSVSALPPGSQRDLFDPYAEKKSPWPKIIGLIVFLLVVYVVLNRMGFIYDWTNGRIGDPKRTVEVQPK